MRKLFREGNLTIHQMSEKTKTSNIPTVIVEDHNEVLHHIYRAIGSKRLPFENGVIVHFDSHPDLVIPEDFNTSKIFDKDYVLNSISIESWLLPAVYAKHFSSLAWIKPPWATQLTEGKHRFQIGRHKETKEMKLTCPESYFVSELAWTSEENLENVSNVCLEVCTLVKFKSPETESNDSTIEPGKTCNSLRFEECALEMLLSQEFFQCLQEKPFVLDIDLDFYSTRNPFLEFFTCEQFTVLSELYHYDHPSDPSDKVSLYDVTQKRKKQLFNLWSLICAVKCEGIIPEEENKKLTALIADLLKKDPTFDLEMIHKAGCTCDDCDLPHHVSTRTEIFDLITATAKFLKTLPRPSLISISRSSRDDYCPPEDVDYIQDSVIDMLTSLYGQLIITKDY